jgi:hypothetical protein
MNPRLGDLPRLRVTSALLVMIVTTALPAATAIYDASIAKGMHDFDFLVGTWAVKNRRLKHLLANNSEWERFEGTLSARLYMGGQAIIDDNVLHAPAGSYRAIALRTFNPSTQKWSVWWFDSRRPNALDPPLVGGFQDGVGTFYADDSFEGKPIRVRFIWRHTAEEAHWEEAFSPDGGSTWEVNWIMDMTRTST